MRAAGLGTVATRLLSKQAGREMSEVAQFLCKPL